MEIKTAKHKKEAFQEESRKKSQMTLNEKSRKIGIRMTVK